MADSFLSVTKTVQVKTIFSLTMFADMVGKGYSETSWHITEPVWSILKPDQRLKPTYLPLSSGMPWLCRIQPPYYFLQQTHTFIQTVSHVCINNHLECCQGHAFLFFVIQEPGYIGGRLFCVDVGEGVSFGHWPGGCIIETKSCFPL